MIDAPVTGYKRKISVYADVLLSGESTLIFANTLWRGPKAWVCFLRNRQSQLEHGVRSFAAAGKPRVAHRTMQVLLIGGHMFPFNNG